MISKEIFIEYLNKYQLFDNKIEKIEEIFGGYIFESDWVDAVGHMLDIFLDENFTNEGKDWIYYALFEDVDDKAAYIKKDKDIFNKEEEIRYPLDTLVDLWNFLLTDKQLYFKNV